jgi:cobalt-zinc-cadmium efflux system outer membrane protein
LAALKNSIYSEVTTAHDRLLAARNTALEYDASIIPARSKIVEEMQKHQNFMLIGLYNLLEAKREEIKAREEYIEALKGYWTSRAELERATGRMLPMGESMKPESAAAPDKSNHANHQGGSS